MTANVKKFHRTGAWEHLRASRSIFRKRQKRGQEIRKFGMTILDLVLSIPSHQNLKFVA